MTAEPQGISGVCPVIAAVFHPDGSLDDDGFRQLTRHLVATGIDSLMIFGVATENQKLRDSERDIMLEIAIEETRAAGVTVIATVADHSREIAIERTRRWESLGADMINVLPSYFLNPPHDQVRRHLQGILGATSLPVIIQSLPLGGNELPLHDIVALARDFPHLVQIKVENVPSAEAVREVLATSQGAVTPLVGWGGLEWLEATAAGAVGVQPGPSLIELYLAAQDRLNAGDRAGFETAFQPLRSPLQQWMRHVEVLIAVEKIILQRRGIISSSYCRGPSHELTEDDLAHIEPTLAALHDLGVTP